MEDHGYVWELIIVDDGSQDETWNMVQTYTLQSTHAARVRILRNKVNRGKGFSVRRGFLEAQNEIVLFSDCDLSTPIQDIHKLLAPIRDSAADAAFGSRALLQSKIDIHQPWFREFGGKCFNRLVRLITGLPYKDTQCGFKVFRREPFVSVFERQCLERFGFDVEILYLARKGGLRLIEVPVVWSHCEDTRVHFLKDSLSMFLDLWRIRWNDLRGRYKNE